MPDGSPPVDALSARNAYVDYLRGFSILLVLATHFAPELSEFEFGGWWMRLVNSGYYGVCIFFVVSGFLITGRVLSRYGSLAAINSREFYAMRIGRIAPGLGLTLCLLSALSLAGYGPFHVSNLGTRLWYALTFQYNRYRSIYGTDILAWDVLWSLSVEELFYLTYPFLCRFLAPRGWLVPLLGAAVVYGLSFRLWWHPSSTDGLYTFSGTVDLLALGCLTALLCRSEPAWARRAGVAAPWAGGLLMLAVCTAIPARFQGNVGPSAVGVGAALYLLGTYERRIGLPRAWTRWLGLSLLAGAGELTYEAYLSHGYLRDEFQFAVHELAREQGHPLAGALADTLLYVLVVFAVSKAVALCWSVPLGRWLRGAITGPRRAVQTQGSGPAPSG